MSGPANHADILIAKADAFRDAKRFRAAAEAYRAALALAPSRADIWVQLGNMLKDDGAFAEAERAYRSALALTPGNADTHLQLGRALRLDGRQEDAFRELAIALDIVPGSRDVINEIIALGRAWDVERQMGLGFTLVQSVTDALSSLRAAIHRIEQDLPAIRALSAVPVAHYDTYRRLYRVPLADRTVGPAKACVVVLGRAAPSDVLLCLASLREQTCGAPRTLMPCLADDGFAPLRAHLASLDPRSWTEVAASPTRDTVSMCTTIRQTLAADGSEDWIVLLKAPARLDTEALSWIAAEGARSSAVAVFSDEDTLRDGGTPRARYCDPALRGSFDPELLSQGYDFGTLLAVRRDVLAAAMATLSDVPDNVLWTRLTAAVAALGALAHIPYVLVSRFAALDEPAPSEPSRPPAPRAVAPLAQRETIDILIPTKNRVDLLEACVTSLVGTATVPELLSMTVIDHQSDDPATRAWLDAQRAQGRLSVLDVDGPFNWSGFNNRATAGTRSPLLLFLNNDVELISAGWDDTVRRLLARPEVGVVGARLAYPDRTLQHAGIVLGINGATEHEGRGAPEQAPGPLGRWQTRRSVSAVTGAFFACRRTDFEALGGFDADDLPVWFSDVDYCLKASSRGLRVLYEPAIFALHHESKSILPAFEPAPRVATYEHAADRMRARWGRQFELDPWYNPHYARFGAPFSLLRPLS